MKILETPIADLFVVEPTVYSDSRGYFLETYNEDRFKSAGILYNFVQDNQSYSKVGTLRGIHFQTSPMEQAKLVSAAYGKVLDVVVDLRKTSRTYKKTFTVELSSENCRQLMVPPGFGHAFVCLSEFAIFSYKCSQLYSREHDAGIRFDDPELKIEWPFPLDKMIFSDKDRSLPYLEEIEARL